MKLQFRSGSLLLKAEQEGKSKRFNFLITSTNPKTPIKIKGTDLVEDTTGTPDKVAEGLLGYIFGIVNEDLKVSMINQGHITQKDNKVLFLVKKA